MNSNKNNIPDAWKVTWSEKDDNWFNDGGTTYHKSKEALDEYVKGVLAKNTDKYSLVPLWIKKLV